jgi:DNA-binding IclR family transcriptional regulator
MQRNSKSTRSPVMSVIKALDILAAFSPEQPCLTLSEIADHLHVPKATAYNLVATLRTRGFLEKTEDERYSLGTAIIPLTQCVRVNVQIRDRAAPLLRVLAQQTQETVYLTIRDGDYALYIYGIESARRLLARTAVGDRVVMHCTAVGKAILSGLSPDEVKAIATRVGLPGFTPHTITDIDKLAADLELTRQRGYSIDQEEHELRTFCLGAPICDESGRVIASCSVAGTDSAILGSRLAQLTSVLMQCADEISRRMGYVTSRPSSLSIARPQTLDRH